MVEEQESGTSKNTVTIEQAGPCRKKVAIEIPQETIKQQADEQYKELAKEAIVPGFRRGRAPRRLLEKRFGKETSEQIKLKLLSEASEAAIKDNGLEVLGDADIDHDKIELPAEGPLKFDFEVEVRPEFELPPLEGIGIEKKPLQVTDEQIDREIEQLRRWSGMWAPKEGGAVEPEDQIIADVILKVEGVEEQEKLDNIEVFVRANGFVGGVPVEKLDEVLVGARVGDERQTSVEVAKTYFREEYRGKKVDIEIKVEDIKYLRPAELDEDFLKKLGVESDSELREGIRDRLAARLESQVRTEMAEQIYKYMVDNTDFDLPLDVVADQAATLLQRQYVNLLSRGLAREQIEEQMGQLRASSEQRAKEQLKAFFVMDKTAAKLGIEVSDEEINGHIARLAIERGQRPERLREEMARDGSLAQFALQVRDEKCVAKLLESAKITQVQPKETAAKKTNTAKKAAKKTPKTTGEAEKEGKKRRTPTRKNSQNPLREKTEG